MIVGIKSVDAILRESWSMHLAPSITSAVLHARVVSLSGGILPRVCNAIAARNAFLQWDNIMGHIARCTFKMRFLCSARKAGLTMGPVLALLLFNDNTGAGWCTVFFRLL